MFFTQDLLTMLCNSDHVLIDGSFKCSPEIFSQMITIHFEFKNRILISVYCFLPNKTQHTYERMLNLLIKHCNMFNLMFNPEKITIDFEAALLNAIRK